MTTPLTSPNVPDRASRPFDLVLFGATGFTGRLVAEYLAERSATSGAERLRFALGGRNREKLESVRAGLVGIDPRLADLPILVADSGDETALRAVAAQTRVVCTTVGPYAIHGLPLVGACAALGTDYCDLTGEVQFIRAAIDQHHATATATGARIVPSCGFDSLPSDLGVHLLGEHFRARGMALAEARLYVEKMAGGASGGTIASMLNLLEEASRDRKVRSLLGDPYALIPDRQVDRGPDGSDQMGVRWDKDNERYSAPFVMAAINTRVVRRSNAIAGYPYGHDFRYSEVMGFRSGARGFWKATGLSIGLGAFIGLAALPPVRKLIAKRIPPGAGPTKEERERGSFRIRIIGYGGHGGHGGPGTGTQSGRERAEALIEGHRDPGYGETARMLGQAALCLALDPRPEGATGGVLTPAVALGTRLIERLRGFGMRWDVVTSGQ
jgi:short subunit dehydrogenase-like uncharacterized protein